MPRPPAPSDGAGGRGCFWAFLPPLPVPLQHGGRHRGHAAAGGRLLVAGVREALKACRGRRHGGRQPVAAQPHWRETAIPGQRHALCRLPRRAVLHVGTARLAIRPAFSCCAILPVALPLSAATGHLPVACKYSRFFISYFALASTYLSQLCLYMAWASSSSLIVAVPAL